MRIAPELLPVIQITLPIVITLFLAAVWQSKRVADLRTDMNRQFDGVNRQFDGVITRLDRIEATLIHHGERITRLEERIPPLIHR